MSKRLLILLTLTLAGCSTTSEHDRAERAQTHRAGLQSNGQTGGQAETPSANAIRKAKAAHIRVHPLCAVCGGGSNIVNGNRNDVHHILTVSRRPELAATPSNLITLCRNDHFVYGHATSWRGMNTNLARSVESARGVIETEVQQ